MAFSVLNWILGTSLNAALRKVLNKTWYQRLDPELRDAVSAWVKTLPEGVALEPDVFFFPRADGALDKRLEIRQRIVDKRRLPNRAQWLEALGEHKDYLLETYGKDYLQSFFHQDNQTLALQLQDLADLLTVRCEAVQELFNVEVMRRLEELGELSAQLETLDPVRNLIRATFWIGKAFPLQLKVQPATSSRDIVSSDLVARCLTLGDTIRLTVTSPRDASVFLFDIGTSGRVTVLLPNRLVRNAKVRAGRSVAIPGQTSGLMLGGVPGIERLVALAINVPVSTGALVSPQELYFIDPDPAAIQKLLAQFDSLDPEERGVGYVEFLVVPPESR